MPVDQANLPDAAEFRSAGQGLPRLRPKQRRVLIITAIALGIVVALFAGFHLFVKTMIARFMAAPPPPTPVEEAVAETRPVPQLLTGIGTLQAVHQVTVAPEVGGRITEIFFQPGAMVAAGQPLLQLFDAPERGDLANYQAQAHLAAANLERAKTLSARQFESRQVVDQQQSLLDQANGNIAKTQAQIAQKLVRAPFAGQLGVRQVEVGAYLNPGGAVVTLTDLSTVWTNFTLPEQDSSRVKIGQEARVMVEAYPGRVFQGKVTAIEPQISAQTRTILIQATLDNPDHALMPGMFAKVGVVLPDTPKMVTVPETAIDYSLYGDSAYLINQDGQTDDGKPILKVSRVPVKIADRFDGYAAIQSGLKDGDHVVRSGQQKLATGRTVSIEPGNALAQPPTTEHY